jgi:hypothetical protein
MNAPVSLGCFAHGLSKAAELKNFSAKTLVK